MYGLLTCFGEHVLAHQSPSPVFRSTPRAEPRSRKHAPGAGAVLRSSLRAELLLRTLEPRPRAAEGKTDFPGSCSGAHITSLQGLQFLDLGSREAMRSSARISQKRCSCCSSSLPLHILAPLQHTLKGRPPLFQMRHRCRDGPP